MARVRFFGWARDLAGTAEWHCPLPQRTGSREVWAKLTAAFPALAPHAGSFLLAVNREYAGEATTVTDEDEIAVIPPVSGG